ncbi:MAG: hypothetical protein Unbinned3459contig1000_56 [Prokaryotic dsDNA virus sp.]|jgi:hypothetical protein|nr:MAG: hypothetical protein Unbinned3459contig1000_56 [Prokaryotic dsDNA virus sp.]|tara:strand:- start:13281 stop:13952 length:672 start_codon:yes stop_codon:yes gene_type:complete
MTQITSTKLDKLNTFELYQHHAALKSSFDFLTPESQELVLAELEACSLLRSRKIDGLYYQIKKNEAAVERGKEIKKEIDDAIKHHQAQVNSMRSMLMELRRRGFAKDNKLIGKDYEFTISPVKDKLEISSAVDDWSADERTKYAMVKKTTTLTDCTNIDGDVLYTDEKVKFETIPNPDAIFNAYEKGELLPTGVKIVPNYAIRTRIILDQTPSKSTSKLLSKS